MAVSEQAGSKAAISADTAWREHASCRYLRPELFFPAGTTGSAAEEIMGAKAVCAGCDVRDRCLLFAFETNQECGIWGGTTEDERRKLRRAWLARRRRPRASTSLNRQARSG